MTIEQDHLYQNRTYFETNEKRPPPKNPHHWPTGSEICKAIRTIARDMGVFCEENISSIWENPPKVNEEQKLQIQTAVAGIEKKLEPAKKRTMKFEEISALYDDLSTPVNTTGFPEDNSPKNKDLAILLQTLNELGYPLLRYYQQLFMGEDRYHLARYLIETALIVAKELNSPSFCPEKGQLLINVRIPPNRTQLDAVYSPSTSDGKSFEEILGSTAPYRILEIKTTLRASRTSGPNKIRAVPNDLIREMQGKLAITVLWWLSNGHDEFPFPKTIRIVFLRGLLPTVVREIKTDVGFLTDWLYSLEENLQNASGEQEEELSKLIPAIKKSIRTFYKRLEEDQRIIQEAHKEEKTTQAQLEI